jgi:AraC-like DNA-binding protein
MNKPLPHTTADNQAIVEPKHAFVDRAEPAASIVDPDAFERLAAEYARRWGASLGLTDPDGGLLTGPKSKYSGDCRQCEASHRAHAIQEALRWGEPTIYDIPSGKLIWAVPVMCNARVLGGLVACIDDAAVFPEEGDGLKVDLRKACTDLRLLAENENLTNAALLATRRRKYRREQKRAERIHAWKFCDTGNVLETYMRMEPDLISAIRKGRRQDAIGILNEILLQIYGAGAGNLDLVKSLVLELVVTMCRTAIQVGGKPQELLGSNYACLVQLGGIDSEEELSHWLVETLNGIMDSIRHGDRRPNMVQLQKAVDFLVAHHRGAVTRETAARAAGLSESHFSRLLKKNTGQGFSDLLNQIRVDHAAELLRNSDAGILQIALRVGFNDQSYFTKIFRRQTGQTPKQYRQSH